MRPFCWLQSGISDIQAWVHYVGPLWAGEIAETEAALEHTMQAIAYLLHGKDECVRKAAKVSVQRCAFLADWSRMTLPFGIALFCSKRRGSLERPQSTRNTREDGE